MSLVPTPAGGSDPGREAFAFPPSRQVMPELRQEIIGLHSDATDSNDNDNPLPIPQTSSAGRTAFENVDVRACILALLAQADLVNFMRVKRQSMSDVARLLYYQLSYGDTQNLHNKDPDRRHFYDNAVYQIDCRGITPTVETWRALLRGGLARDPDPNFDEDTRTDRERYFYTYRPDACRILSSLLKRKHPFLSMIAFGDDYDGGTTWRVEFETSSDAASLTSSEPGSDSALPPGVKGHVDLISQRAFDCSSEPPVAITPPPAPSSHYTLSERFNLVLYQTTNGLPMLCGAWSLALRSNRCFAEVYNSISIDVQLPLSSITALYQQQIDRGHTGRLEEILAHGVSPWSLGDMWDFAKVASATLVSLYLTHFDYDADNEALVSFADLPTLISIIRIDLPKLDTLMIALKGIETAEETCARFLRSDSLDNGGTITHLIIVTPLFSTSLFDTIRCLSSICAADASVDISNDGAEPWTKDAQSDCLYYFRAQSPARRKHLSTVDLASLGVISPSDLHALTYSDDGRPQHLSKGVEGGMICVFGRQGRTAARDEAMTPGAGSRGEGSALSVGSGSEWWIVDEQRLRFDE